MRKNLTVRGVLPPNSPHEARRRAQADITSRTRRWSAVTRRAL